MNHASRNSAVRAGLILLAICVFAVPLAAAPPESAGTGATNAPASEKKDVRTLGIVLYPKFELLDVYGPAEVFGNLGRRMKVVMVAQKTGPIASAQGPQVVAD